MCTRSLVFSILFSIAVLPVAADDAARPNSKPIDAWLLLTPVERPLPAFHEEGEGLGAEALLDVADLSLEGLRPAAGAVVGARSWEIVSAEDGVVALGGSGKLVKPSVAYLAVYLESRRFTKPALVLESEHPLRAYLDGEPLEDGDEHELALAPGKHLLLVRLVRNPGESAPWTVLATLSPGEDAESPRTSTDPTRLLGFADILASETINGLDLSSDGALLAVHRRRPSIPSDDGKAWSELRDAESGTLLREFAEALSGFTWAPSGSRYAYAVVDEGKTTLVVESVEGSERRELLDGMENVSGFRWCGEGALVFGVTDKEESSEGVAKDFNRLRSLEDRWSGHRDKTHLYRVEIETGERQRLTAGTRDTSLQDVRPDGSRLVFTRETYDYASWPFLFTEIYELDLGSLEARRIARTAWSSSAQYAPDGDALLVLGGPSAFGDVGVNVTEGLVPNEYDTQAYLLDIENGEVRALTREFDPKVEAAAWADGGRLILRAEIGARIQLFELDPTSLVATRLEAGVDAVRRFALARDGSRLAWYGSSTNAPGELRVLDLPDGEPRLIDVPASSALEDVRIGKVEDFDFTSSAGVRVEGVVHYPPDFTPSRRYPALVYYYGGTSPVTRSFGGRWPKNVWASHGYVVYVLQPSGATGYGQDFSAAHVNNWGLTVADEIVEGTRAFLEAHPFIDPERVGCMGASYGGFMTELLVTRTDIFGAAMSHAGISSLTGYWGEGWWGYIYSAIATARKYPWNAPELYVEQSAVYAADKVETPILLLHGAVDTNVPTGQSELFYAALKLLGKDVEYVRIADENHLIMDYDRRLRWMQTIVAYFDWKLKGDANWWNELYPPPAT